MEKSTQIWTKWPSCSTSTRIKTGDDKRAREGVGLHVTAELWDSLPHSLRHNWSHITNEDQCKLCWWNIFIFGIYICCACFYFLVGLFFLLLGEVSVLSFCCHQTLVIAYLHSPPPGCKCCTWVVVSFGVIKAACSEEKKKAAIKAIFKSLISVFSVVLLEKRHWQPRSLPPFGALIVLTVVKVCVLHLNLNHWSISVCCLLHLLWLCMWAIVIWPQIKSTYLSFQMGKASLYKKHLTTPFNSVSVVWFNEVNPVRSPAKYH